MATIEQLVTRVETRLALASGLDVQIHAEDRIVEMIRHKYNVLFDKFWYQNHTFYLTATLDGTTGQITSDISDEVDRFIDIRSIYYDTDNTPLPLLNMQGNPSQVTSRCIIASSQASKVFKILPITTTGDVHLWYRKRMKNTVWENQEYDTEITLDEELIFSGVMYEYFVLDSSNQMAAQMYGNMFSARMDQMKKDQSNMPMSKHPLSTVDPQTQWR